MEEMVMFTESKQDIEPPAAPPTRELNEELIYIELSTIEASNNLDSIQTASLPMAVEEQYIFASRYEAAEDNEYSQYSILQPQHTLQALRNISLIFKALDNALNVARFAYEPTVNNARKVIIDSADLYSILHGLNWYSTAINVADIIYSCYIGEYSTVLQHTVRAAAYTGLYYAAAPLI